MLRHSMTPTPGTVVGKPQARSNGLTRSSDSLQPVDSRTVDGGPDEPVSGGRWTVDGQPQQLVSMEYRYTEVYACQLKPNAKGRPRDASSMCWLVGWSVVGGYTLSVWTPAGYDARPCTTARSPRVSASIL